MFERFTTEARAAVIAAQDVARETRSPLMDSRTLLVAILDPAPGTPDVSTTVPDILRTLGIDPASVAATARSSLAASDPLDGEALASLGIDLDAVRAATDTVFGEGSLDAAAPKARGRKRVTFAPEAAKAMELSLREAIRLKAKVIEPRHLLLGLLRADCPGGRILQGAATEAGVDLPALRTVLENQPAAA